MNPWRERIDELLMTEATERLSDDEQSELEDLLREHPGTDRYAFQEAVGAAFLSVANSATKGVPADLYSKLLATGEELIDRSD